jgi:hypothetical protein
MTHRLIDARWEAHRSRTEREQESQRTYRRYAEERERNRENAHRTHYKLPTPEEEDALWKTVTAPSTTVEGGIVNAVIVGCAVAIGSVALTACGCGVGWLAGLWLLGIAAATQCVRAGSADTHVWKDGAWVLRPRVL